MLARERLGGTGVKTAFQLQKSLFFGIQIGGGNENFFENGLHWYNKISIDNELH